MMSIYDLDDSDWLQIEQAARGTVSGSGKEWPALVVAIAKISGEPVAELWKQPAAWLTGFCKAVLAIHPGFCEAVLAAHRFPAKTQESHKTSKTEDNDVIDYVRLKPGDKLQTGDEVLSLVTETKVEKQWYPVPIVNVVVPENAESELRRPLAITDEFMRSLDCFTPVYCSGSVSVFYHKKLQGLFIRETTEKTVMRWMMNTTEIATVWRRSQLLQLLKNFA